MSLGFRDLYRSERPDDHFIVTYNIVPPTDLSVEQAIANLLLITTQRTLTRTGIEQPVDRLDRILTRPLFSRDGSWATVEIAYPLDICRPEESLAHLLLVLSAAVEYKYAEKFWLRGVTLPKSFLRSFKGPRFGVSGVRNVLGVNKRPPLGLIVKPRYGGNINATLDACREALRGGVDFLVDDLLLGNPLGEMSLRERLPKFVALCREIERETGHKKSYWPNITGYPMAAYQDASFAATNGAGGIVVDAYVMGFAFFEELVDQLEAPIPVVTTNMGSGVASRVPNIKQDEKGLNPTNARFFAAGVDETVFALFSRVAGADGVHVGTSGSECFGTEWDDPIEVLYREISTGDRLLEPSFRVAEGDLDIHTLWQNIDILGKGHGDARDVLVEATNAILGYTDAKSGKINPREGARLFRFVLDIIWETETKVQCDVELEKMTNKHEDLFDYLAELKYFNK